MIAIKQLITVAPFDANIKETLLNQVDTLSVDKKLDLANLCWNGITTMYQLKLREEYDRMLREAAEGKANYKKEDFKQVEERLFTEIAQKLQAIENDEQINEVREKLDQATSPLKSG